MIWIALAWVCGMALHVAVRIQEWHKTHKSEALFSYATFFLRYDFIAVKIGNLLLMYFWASGLADEHVGFSAPLHPITALAGGYFGDSVGKHIVLRLFGNRDARLGTRVEK